MQRECAPPLAQRLHVLVVSVIRVHSCILAGHTLPESTDTAAAAAAGASKAATLLPACHQSTALGQRPLPPSVTDFALPLGGVVDTRSLKLSLP